MSIPISRSPSSSSRRLRSARVVSGFSLVSAGLFCTRCARLYSRTRCLTGCRGRPRIDVRPNVRRGTCGPVAQLGARMNGIHEVTGSIPVWSTNFLSFGSRRGHNGRARPVCVVPVPPAAQCPSSELHRLRSAALETRLREPERPAPLNQHATANARRHAGDAGEHQLFQSALGAKPCVDRQGFPVRFRPD